MKERLPQLDGLRGCAIAIVVVGHLLAFHWGFGFKRSSQIAPMGVDLFFVLSGFLITGILLDSQGKQNYFRNFYARRALRTWPLYALLLLFLWGVGQGRIPGLNIPAQLHWQVYACYAQNLIYFHFGQVIFMPLANTWSLAVEEQFYLIWPVLVWLVPRRQLWMYLVPVIVVAPIARAILPHFGVDPYYNPICRFDAMAMGALLAVWLQLKLPDGKLVGTVAQAALAMTTVVAAVSYWAGIMPVMIESLASCAFTATVAMSLQSQWLRAVLSHRALRYTGKISYCMYLCHAVVGYWIYSLMPQIGVKAGATRAAFVVLGSYVIATVSWYSFESQILKLKRLFVRRSTAVSAGCKLNRRHIALIEGATAE